MADRLVKNKHALTKEKYLLDEEQAHFVSVLDKFKDKDPRNCTLLWLALHTGARASEILNLTIKDFCAVEGTVLIHGLKGSDDREIPLPDWLAKRVAELEPGADGRLFPIQYNMFRHVWVNYRPVKKKLHSLRHTFAINFYKKTKDVRLLGMALGHRQNRHTLIYADYQYKVSELRKALLG
jgi:integrase/recombinase XerC